VQVCPDKVMLVALQPVVAILHLDPEAAVVLLDLVDRVL
jgi:hypothetical protein